MMLILSDRVKQNTTTSGSGNIVLTSSFRSFQTFASGIGDGNTTYYTIENGPNYEVGVGTYTSGNNTLSRDLILESSNNDQPINLIDTSIVFCTYPASYSVFLNNGYISGQMPHYSGIAFPDGTFQTTSIDGDGSSDKIAYWLDDNTVGNIDQISWDGSTLSINSPTELNTLVASGDVNLLADLSVSGDTNIAGYLTAIDGISSTGVSFTDVTLVDTDFYRTSAGCFFHAYVDNATDNMVALYSSNETNPYWRLGIKSYSTNYTTPPTVGYVEAENGQAGIYATSQNYAVITYSNGFWIGHKNINVLNASSDDGVSILNSTATAVPLTVRAAAAQSAYVQEWQTYASQTVASVDIDGLISIDRVRFGDGTVQTTAASSSSSNYLNVTSSTNLSVSDGVVFANSSSSSIVLSLPTASGVGGSRIIIKRKNTSGSSNLVTIQASGTETLDGSSKYNMVYDYESITVVSDNSNWFIV